jgi:hypothetical protein
MLGARSQDQPALGRARCDRVAAGVADAGNPVVDRVGGDGESGPMGMADVRSEGLAIAAAHVLGKFDGQREDTWALR